MRFSSAVNDFTTINFVIKHSPHMTTNNKSTSEETSEEETKEEITQPRLVAPRYLMPILADDDEGYRWSSGKMIAFALALLVLAGIIALYIHGSNLAAPTISGAVQPANLI